MIGQLTSSPRHAWDAAATLKGIPDGYGAQAAIGWCLDARDPEQLAGVLRKAEASGLARGALLVRPADAEEARICAQAIANAGDLHHITLCFPDPGRSVLSEEAIDCLAAAIGSKPSMACFEFFGSSHFGPLLKALGGRPELRLTIRQSQHADVSHIRDFVDDLLPRLNEWTHLTAIDAAWYHDSLRPVTVEEVLSGLGRQNRLDSISINGIETSTAFCDLLRGCTSPTQLAVLSGWEVGELAELIASNGCSATRVTLRMAPNCSGDCVLKALETNTSITEFRMECDGLDLDLIEPVLTKNTQLASLHLRGAPFLCTSRQPISQALLGNRALLSCSIACVPAGGSGDPPHEAGWFAEPIASMTRRNRDQALLYSDAYVLSALSHLAGSLSPGGIALPQGAIETLAHQWETSNQLFDDRRSMIVNHATRNAAIAGRARDYAQQLTEQLANHDLEGFVGLCASLLRQEIELPARSIQAFGRSRQIENIFSTALRLAQFPEIASVFDRAMASGQGDELRQRVLDALAASLENLGAVEVVQLLGALLRYRNASGKSMVNAALSRVLRELPRHPALRAIADAAVRSGQLGPLLGAFRSLGGEEAQLLAARLILCSLDTGDLADLPAEFAPDHCHLESLATTPDLKDIQSPAMMLWVCYNRIPRDTAGQTRLLDDIVEFCGAHGDNFSLMAAVADRLSFAELRLQLAHSAESVAGALRALQTNSTVRTLHLEGPALAQGTGWCAALRDLLRMNRGLQNVVILAPSAIWDELNRVRKAHPGVQIVIEGEKSAAAVARQSRTAPRADLLPPAPAKESTPLALAKEIHALIHPELDNSWDFDDAGEDSREVDDAGEDSLDVDDASEEPWAVEAQELPAHALLARFVAGPLDPGAITCLAARRFAAYAEVPTDRRERLLAQNEIETWCTQHSQPGLLLAMAHAFQAASIVYDCGKLDPQVLKDKLWLCEAMRFLTLVGVDDGNVGLVSEWLTTPFVETRLTLHIDCVGERNIAKLCAALELAISRESKPDIEVVTGSRTKWAAFASLSGNYAQFTWRKKVPNELVNSNAASLNGKAGRSTTCMPLALHVAGMLAHRAKQRLLGVAQELDFTRLGTVEGIRETVKFTEFTANLTIQKFTENHLVAHARWGAFLCRQVLELKDRKQVSKVAILRSTNHAMTLGLEVVDGSYELFFYDGNFTDTIRRLRVHDMRELAELDFKASLFMDDPGAFDAYFGSGKSRQQYLVLSAWEDPYEPSRDVSIKPRTLSTQFANLDKVVYPDAVVHMTTMDFPDELAVLASSLRPPERKNDEFASTGPRAIPSPEALLLTKLESGRSIMNTLLRHGYAKSVDAVGDLLAAADRLSPALRAHRAALMELLSADDPRINPPYGAPALAFVYASGYASTLLAFCRLLEIAREMAELPADGLMRMAIGSDGIDSGLLVAQSRGHADLVAACSSLLELIHRTAEPTTKWVEQFVLGCDQDHVPGTRIALDSGHHETYKASVKLLRTALGLEPISREVVRKVLGAPVKDGSAGLAEAVKRGKVATIAAFGDGLEAMCQRVPTVQSDAYPDGNFTLKPMEVYCLLLGLEYPVSNDLEGEQYSNFEKAIRESGPVWSLLKDAPDLKTVKALRSVVTRLRPHLGREIARTLRQACDATAANLSQSESDSIV
ncbi:MAG: ShET2/EspL2 family type III secretion system effector toxin [Pseudomonadota bacterium]